MAAFQKFDSFVEALAEKKHDLGADTLKFMLTNTLPVAGNTVFANLVDITADNGYTAGGTAVGITSSAQVSGTYSLVPSGNVVFTASGGSIGPFQYAVLYNDTALNKELIGFFAYTTSISLLDTESFTLTVGGTLLTLV